MKTVIVPGSFDPMTLGHLDLVRLAAKRYDKVVVAVMVNASNLIRIRYATKRLLLERARWMSLRCLILQTSSSVTLVDMVELLMIARIW